MSVKLFYTNTTDYGTDSFSDGDSISKLVDFYGNFLWFSFIFGIIRDYIVAVCIFCVQTFFIFIFWRYSEFRTRINLFVLFNSCLGILEFFRNLHSRLNALFSSLTVEILCIEIEIDHLTHIFNFVLAIFLGFDCVVTKCQNSFVRLYMTLFVYAIISVNLIYITMLITKVTLCFSNPIGWLFGRLHQTKTIAYTVMAIILILLNIMAKKNNLDTSSKHGLKISNITLFAYIPVYINHVLIMYFKFHYFLREILMFSQFFAEILARLHPCLVLYLVFKETNPLKNLNFIVRFKNVLSRNRIEVDTEHVDVKIIANDELSIEEENVNHLCDNNYKTALLI